MTARDVLDAVADELSIPFVIRPFNERAFLDLVLDEVRSVDHDLEAAIEALAETELP